MKSLVVAVTFIGILVGKSDAQTTIPARAVTQHIGETVTVCEKVFSGTRVKESNAVLLDLGGFHPSPQLLVIIPAELSDKFKGHPEIDYDGKDITVTGKVIIYKGKPGILIQNPSHLRLVMIDN